MKRLIPAALLCLATLGLLATTASAATPETHLKAAKAHMGECCIDAAKASKACCGKDADAVQAKYANYQLTTKAQEMVLAGEHECCAKALKAGGACCGKDADALQLAHAKKVVHVKAELMARADMHDCCSNALTAGEGCCGKDAKGVKADFKKATKKKTKLLLQIM